MNQTDKNLYHMFGEKSISECQPMSQISSSHREGKDTASTYENMLQELESEIRGHIRFQQQLKLHIETVELKVEQLEAENEHLTSQNVSLLQRCDQNEAELANSKAKKDEEDIITMRKLVNETLEEMQRY